MESRAPISTIMTKDVVKLRTTDNLTTAEQLFKQKKITHIPVVNGKQMKGMLSYTDLLRISFADAVDEDAEIIDKTVYNMFAIEHVMTRKVVTVSPETTIKETAEIFAKNEFHALPVCKDEELVGIITTTDLLKYMINQD